MQKNNLSLQIHLKDINQKQTQLCFPLIINIWQRSGDQTCKIWSLEKQFNLSYNIQGHTSDILSVAFSPDNKYLATGSGDNTCKIWDVEKGFRLVNTINEHSHYIRSIAFSATVSNDLTFKIWNFQNAYEFINSIQGHPYHIAQVAFSPDGRQLVTGSQDGTCKIWKVDKGFELMYSFQKNANTLKALVFLQIPNIQLFQAREIAQF